MASQPNYIYAPGPGDFDDAMADKEFARDMRLSQIESELWADHEIVSEIISDVLWYRRGGRNNPLALPALEAFIKGDYLEFGNILSTMTARQIREKAEDRIENPEEYDA
jgi:hypothetical protein